MYRSRLLLGVAAVFAGITVSLSILGFVYNLFLVVFAIPFAITTAILWYHATGRLQKKVERDAVYGDPTRGFGPNSDGVGAGARRRTRQRTRERAGWRTRGDERQRATVGSASGPSSAEAYRILGVDVTADDETVREAYREKVKNVHPDQTDGNEEAFKRVNRAYERVRNDR
ncbi:J domain-containing protein [Haladaptatus caseinilyticus]|uniref:J domain-containing protein n=1 Tax=Haladaptatus caseinilyticus TaxID=2993314 RepID=UPI00224AA969|nr:J domain-containing protein [Haladaptatus caseinilyticus]